jgi:hypothetical protein
MWRDTPEGAPYAWVHPMYSWPIGVPTLSHPPESFAAYQLPGAPQGVVGRPFSNGFAVHNPLNVTAEDVRLPGGPYIDPASNASVVTLTIKPQSGRVLLRHW